MSENGRFRIGVVGAGYWGVNHVRVFTELPGAVVAAVCDQREGRLDIIRRRFRGIEAYTDVTKMCDESQVDAVVISTPASTHYEIAKRCLERGKHLLVEKPVTTTSEDAARLVDLAESQDLVLMVGHTFMFNAGVRAVKRHLDTESLGQLYYLHATRTNLGPIRTDVNAIWDLAAHDVSIFDFLLGQMPVWASAVGARVLGNGREDVGFATLGYAGGEIANIHVSWADPNKVREVVIVGSRMRIVFNDLAAQERVRLYYKGVTAVREEKDSACQEGDVTCQEADSYGEYRFLMRDGDIVSPMVQASEPLKNQSMHFLECVKRGMRPISDGRTGLRVVKVMEAIDRSMQRKGAPVEV